MAVIKITPLHFNLLRNDQHYQYGSEFDTLVIRTDPKLLKIEEKYQVWKLAYQNEDEAIKKIAKSAFTGDISEADRKRDHIYRGLCYYNKAMLYFFDSEVVAAATRLQIIFDTYGNISRKRRTAKTGAYTNLLNELRNPLRADDVKNTGIGMWMDELGKKNSEVASLTQHRYDETADRPDIVAKEARTRVDDAYLAITEHIDALMVLEPTEVCEQFIRRLNAIVEQYNNSAGNTHRVRGNTEEQTVVEE
jgi:hypothetical protein